MEASASVETSTEARLPARGKAMGGSTMIKTTEGAGVVPGLAMRCESMLASRKSSRSSTVKSAAVIEAAIGENSAVRYVAVVVKHDPVVPIVSPVSPSPAKPSKETDSKAQAPGEAWPREGQSGITVPAGPNSNRCSIDDPRIILRYINDLRIRGLDHNSLSLLFPLFLRGTLQVPRLFRTVAHYLNSIHHLLFLVDVSIAKR